MIDIMTYRQRIGCFSPCSPKSKFLSDSKLRERKFSSSGGFYVKGGLTLNSEGYISAKGKCPYQLFDDHI